MSNWKNINKPSSCTKNPIEYHIPKFDRYETLRKIRQETLEAYGEDISSECPNRKVCITGKCIGRPLPWKSETARPFLEELKKTSNIVDDKLYISTDCSKCPIALSCKSLCYQMEDYINRDKTEEPLLVGIEKEPEQEDDILKGDFLKFNIPWDSISDRRTKIVKHYLFDRFDFKTVAMKTGLNNQARAKYEYYAAITTLSEVATIRLFFKENEDKLTPKQKNIFSLVYYENKSISDAADKMGVTKQAAQQMITRVLNKYNVTWPVFVKKIKKQTKYNTSKVLQ